MIKRKQKTENRKFLCHTEKDLIEADTKHTVLSPSGGLYSFSQLSINFWVSRYSSSLMANKE